MRFAERLKKHLETKGLVPYQVTKRYQIDQAYFNKVLNGKRAPTDALLVALAAIPEMELSLEALRAWKALDEYGEDVITHARRIIESAPPGVTEDSIRRVLPTVLQKRRKPQPQGQTETAPPSIPS